MCKNLTCSVHRQVCRREVLVVDLVICILSRVFGSCWLNLVLWFLFGSASFLRWRILGEGIWKTCQDE